MTRRVFVLLYTVIPRADGKIRVLDVTFPTEVEAKRYGDEVFKPASHYSWFVSECVDPIKS